MGRLQTYLIPNNYGLLKTETIQILNLCQFFILLCYCYMINHCIPILPTVLAPEGFSLLNNFSSFCLLITQSQSSPFPYPHFPQHAQSFSSLAFLGALGHLLTTGLSYQNFLRNSVLFHPYSVFQPGYNFTLYKPYCIRFGYNSIYFMVPLYCTQAISLFSCYNIFPWYNIFSNFFLRFFLSIYVNTHVPLT